MDSKTCTTNEDKTPELPKDKSHNYRFESNRKYFTICIYALGVILIGSIIIYMILNLGETKLAIRKLINTLMPFIIACFIAYMVNPIYQFIHTRILGKFNKIKPSLKNAFSLLGAYMIFLGLITVILLYIIPEFSNSISDLFMNIPIEEIISSASTFIMDIEEHFPGLDLDFVQQKLNDLTPELMSYGTDLVKNIFPMLLNFSVSIVRVAINILLSLVISCYLISNKNDLSKNAMRMLYAFMDKEKADALANTAKECNSIFSKFIIGKSIDSIIIGIICFVAMLILRLPYALLLSVIVGVTNMIPYFGPFVGAIPGIVVLLIVDPLQAVIFAVMILALQQFDGLYLGPKILGESTGLKPLWVIFAITVGGAYYGVLGMFLGVPVVAVISYLLNRLITHRLKYKKQRVE